MSNNSANQSLFDKLKIYQNKLLQIRKGNRCVCLSRIYNKHNFDLSRLLENHSKKIDELLQQSFKRKKPLCILPDSDFSDEATVMRRHLKDLARNIKQVEDETGSQYCYFGFPFLEGHVTQENYIRGPLVLFPTSVYYGREGSGEIGWYVKFSDSAPISNHTLFASLKKIGGFKMNDTFESDFEDMMSSFEPKTQNIESEFIATLSDLLINNGFTLVSSNSTVSKISTNTDIKSGLTLSLQNITKDEIESLERQPFRINNYKIIGSFPQGESAIYQDYENLISKIQGGDTNNFITDILGETDSPLEFAEDSDDENLVDLDKVPDKDLNLVLPSDSSQDQVVLASQNRKITLVRGPPGTGKSQVIVNVISNALSKGQTVLVVCQKRAALEVVHQRLGEKNLDRYAVLLNKEKEDRAKMYHQLKQILEQPGNYEKDEGPLLESTSRQIDELIAKHSQISYALSKEYFGGTNVQQLYTKSNTAYSRKLDLNGIGNEIQYADFDDFLYTISQIEENYKKFEDTNYSWKNRTNFAQRSSSDKNKINGILSDILLKSQNCIILSDKSSQDTLIKLASEYSRLNSEIKSLESKIIQLTESIQTILTTHNVSVSISQLDFIKQVEAGMILWNKFGDYNKILDIKENKILETSHQKQMELLDSFSESTEKKSFWKKLTDSDAKRKDKIKSDFLARPENSGKNPLELKNKLQNGLELLNLANNSPFKEQILANSLVIRDESEQNLLLRYLKELNTANMEFSNNTGMLQGNLVNLRETFEKNKLFFDKNEDTEQLITKVINGKEILQNIDLFSEFVNSNEIKTINEKTLNSVELQAHIQNLYDDLDDFDKLQSHDIRKSDLSFTQSSVLEQCVLKMSKDENWSENIKQEIYHYWIETIEQDNQILKAGHFDDYKQNQIRLTSLLEKKSNLLIRKIIGSIESNSDFRPGMGKKRTQRETEYNTLSYELGKKRKVKSVRKLLEEYEHILFDIAPCWLASPEMVSNIFPLEQNMFDLVIVDEASQLAAERALPFLYRGSRIIIAGDEHQLKPHDLFQIKEEENEDEEDDTIDIESLLILAKRRFTSTTLRWHYRSKWQELISFSNHAFYNGLLQVSPNVQLKAPKPPIEWISCDGGIWENRSNIVEASKVVDVLHGILQEHGNKKIPTIGIITFNDQQRNVILDEIENRQKKDPDFNELYKQVETPASGKKDDEIFVRNIENVQGDERDIIIFSVGYAKDNEGNFRLQFGTLNQDGGENRLNVAVTRASEKIIVVCSIDPRDMRVESTKNPGPKRLKDFLMYAQAVSNADGIQVEQILESLSSAMNKTQQHTKYFDSEFEELVHDRLANLGYEVATQVGYSNYRIDLAIVHPNDPSRYILGIECDGAMFHSAKSVRERDVIRQQFLERRGWTIDRIWSRNWWRNPEKEIARIKERVDLLVKK